MESLLAIPAALGIGGGSGLIADAAAAPMTGALLGGGSSLASTAAPSFMSSLGSGLGTAAKVGGGVATLKDLLGGGGTNAGQMPTAPPVAPQPLPSAQQGPGINFSPSANTIAEMMFRRQ